MAELTVSKRMLTPGHQFSWYSLNNAAVFFPNLSSASASTHQYCGATKPEFALFRRFFEVPADKDCFRLKLTLGKLQILSAEKEDTGWEVLGDAHFADGGRRRHSQLVTIWLPAAQKLFPGISNFMSALLGPASSEVEQNGSYIDRRTGIKREIFIQASPRYLQIGGIIENRLITDLLPVSEYGQSVSGWSVQ
jgi:hypothetical protein